jgi:hypothetical protein
MGEKGKVYKILVRKPIGNKSLGRPRRRWIDNNNMGISGM